MPAAPADAIARAETRDTFAAIASAYEKVPARVDGSAGGSSRA
jgi:hypothetical protein